MIPSEVKEAWLSFFYIKYKEKLKTVQKGNRNLTWWRWGLDSTTMGLNRWRIQSGIRHQTVFISSFHALILPLNLQVLYHQTLMLDLMLSYFDHLGDENFRTVFEHSILTTREFSFLMHDINLLISRTHICLCVIFCPEKRILLWAAEPELIPWMPYLGCSGALNWPASIFSIPQSLTRSDWSLLVHFKARPVFLPIFRYFPFFSRQFVIIHCGLRIWISHTRCHTRLLFHIYFNNWSHIKNLSEFNLALASCLVESILPISNTACCSRIRGTIVPSA
jgi:hypothetical protein